RDPPPGRSTRGARRGSGRACPSRLCRTRSVRDAEQCDGAILRGGEGVRLEGRRREKDSRLGAEFPEVVLERFDVSAPHGQLLPAAADQDVSPPWGSAHYSFELKEIASLRLGQCRPPLYAQLRDLEPDLPQFAHGQDLEVLGREVRHFDHQSTSRGG